MPNPTVRRERIAIKNEDGTITERIRSIRQNGDVSEMVFYKAPEGRKLAIWHVVYDAKANLVHGPHEKYRSPDAIVAWPPDGYGKN